MKYYKLNIGCGKDIKKCWINLDKIYIDDIDIVHDIEKYRLPFQDESFNEVLCKDVLEHIEYLPVMKEVYRILKKGGRLTIRVPHFTSRYSFSDPTHKKLFSIKTFEFFVLGRQIDYYFDYHFNKLQRCRINFEKGPLIFNYLIESLINMTPRFQILFEATFLSRIFPAENLIVELIK